MRRDLFDELAARGGGGGAVDSSFVVQCSYVEVLKDKINDLLGGKRDLAIRESPSKGAYVGGLHFERADCADDVLRAIELGDSRRVCAAMTMNARSSSSISM